MSTRSSLTANQRFQLYLWMAENRERLQQQSSAAEVHRICERDNPFDFKPTYHNIVKAIEAAELKLSPVSTGNRPTPAAIGELTSRLVEATRRIDILERALVQLHNDFDAGLDYAEWRQLRNQVTGNTKMVMDNGHA